MAAFGFGLTSVAHAQPPAKATRVGILIFGSPEGSGHLVDAFKAAMRQLGHVEASGIRFDVRWALGKTEHLPQLAQELVALQSNVIVVGATPTARAALNATTTIPIVGIVLDPIATGFAKSLARPGGNFTGLSNFSVDTSSKLIELHLEVTPRISRIAVLWNPLNPGHATTVNNLKTAARAVSVSLLPLESSTAGEIDGAFTRLVREHVRAIIVPVDTLFFLQRQQIAALALKHRIASVFAFREMVEAGGLICYGHNNAEQYRRAAVYVDKILKGANAAELPIEQATAFELVINARTAKALGLTIPPALLLRAADVLE